jgi:hypothetical protein
LDTFIVTSPLSGEAFDILQTQEVKSKKDIFYRVSSSAFNIDNPLQFSVAEGNVSLLSLNITFRHNGAVAVIPQDVLGNLYFNTFREKITPVFTKTISNLLNMRNHLSLQLDLKCGNISEEYFDQEEPRYLSEVEEISLEQLKEETKVLFGFTNLPFDSEDISEILNCSVDDAEKAISQYLGGV